MTNTNTTHVRTARPKSDGSVFNPLFARTEVSPAKSAAANAYNFQGSIATKLSSLKLKCNAGFTPAKIFRKVENG